MRRDEKKRAKEAAKSKQGLSSAKDTALRNKERRKQLAERTRAFRKRSEEERPKHFGALLKLYQKEVDTLTRRGRAAEKAFLAIYEALYEAPDPCAVLRALRSVRRARAHPHRRHHHDSHRCRHGGRVDAREAR